ncbi:pro-pol polyprotein [Plakobranchus ocellatus]|uniref:Pro-pol polyprotein n=1 Tax=Plakobranchus ocellatus TaxID=259542 RepID=A0AAV4CFI4_9GAST|nr:pro-pol polyprotein [Plakobranchus ocellatus]
MGHCNREDLLKLESKVEGMKITDRSSKFQCHVCPQAKLSNTRSRVPDTTARKPFDLVHIEPESLDGHKYSLVCVDSFSNLTFVYFLKSKGDAHEAFEQFLADIAPYGSVKSVRSDQGGEFISQKFTSMLVRHKIRHEMSAPYSQHQNGKAERAWRTLFEMARC